jgi:hypothetical protein
MASAPTQLNKENYLGKRNPTGTPANSAISKQERLFNEGSFIALMQISEDLHRYLTKKSNLDEEVVGKCSFVNNKVS